MSNQLVSMWRSLLLAAAIMFPLDVWSAQITDTSSVVKFGEITNGLRAEAELVTLQDEGPLLEILLWVHSLDTSNNYSNSPSEESNHTESRVENRVDKLMKNEWEYYMPTNSFCGPVELRDHNGREVRLLKPDVSLSVSYPATYSLKTERSNYLNRFQPYSGPGIFPLPLMPFSPRTELVRFQTREYLDVINPHPVSNLYQRWFQLTDFFEIKEPGEYKLTVWPKIYKRSATNSDLCQRIDLPPVSATFTWNDGEPSK